MATLFATDQMPSKTDRTIKKLERALKRDPDDHVFRDLGLIYLTVGRLAEAPEMYGELLEVRPRFRSDGYALAGAAQWATGKYKEATAIWNEGCRSTYGVVDTILLLFFVAAVEPGLYDHGLAMQLSGKFLAACSDPDWTTDALRFAREEMAEEEFLERIRGENDETLTMAATFQVGARRITTGDVEGFGECMRECVQFDDDRSLGLGCLHVARFEAGVLGDRASHPHPSPSAKGSRPKVLAPTPSALEAVWPQSKFYLNIVIHGCHRPSLLQWLRDEKQTAIVSPQGNGSLVLFSAVSTEREIEELARDLSKGLSCVCMAAAVIDDDVLRLWLFVNGSRRDRYDSTPDYVDNRKSASPEGGKPKTLIKAFDSPSPAGSVETVLRRNYAFARERHQALVDLLGIPGWCVGVDYSDLSLIDLPKGFVHIGKRKASP